MERLRRLDGNVTKPGMIAALIVGLISALVMGIGMCCTMVWEETLFVWYGRFFPPTALDEYMPYIKHFHFKLFEMTEEGPEYSMDYKGLLQYLHSRNYEGYVSTEYEGNRFTLPGTPCQEKQQVSAHLKYVNACLDEIYGR